MIRGDATLSRMAIPPQICLTRKDTPSGPRLVFIYAINSRLRQAAMRMHRYVKP
jgi:hypothetical protein